MTTSQDLDAEIEDARSLLYHIEIALDSGRIDEAHIFAADLAEVMYRARLLDLAERTDYSAITGVAGRQKWESPPLES